VEAGEPDREGDVDMVSLYQRPAGAAAPASARPAPAEHAVPRADRSITIEDVVEQRLVSAEFQKIVRLDTGESIGFEAFARGPAGERSNPGARVGAAGAAGR
jgi:hypothetical protein